MLRVKKKEFAQTVAAEGITLNGDYRDITTEWKWISNYLRTKQETKNVQQFRDHSINLLFNERFGDREIHDIVSAFKKVEDIFSK